MSKAHVGVLECEDVVLGAGSEKKSFERMVGRMVRPEFGIRLHKETCGLGSGGNGGIGCKDGIITWMHGRYERKSVGPREVSSRSHGQCEVTPLSVGTSVDDGERIAVELTLHNAQGRE